MMWRLFQTLIAITLLANGCQGGQEEENYERQDLDRGRSIPRAALTHEEMHGELLAGYYFEDDGYKILKRYPDGRHILITGTPDELPTRYDELTDFEAEPVFAYLCGNFQNEHCPGLFSFKTTVPGIGLQFPVDWQADYMYVTGVIELKRLTRDNLLFPVVFRCFGEEPFWALEIIPPDEAVLIDVNYGQYLYFGYAPAKVTDGAYLYEFPLKWGPPEIITPDENISSRDIIKVTIAPAECTDSMSGQMYGYSAKVEFLGKTLEGCAEKDLR